MGSSIWKIVMGGSILLFIGMRVAAQESEGWERESFARRFVHRLDSEVRPEYIFQTNPFLGGLNEKWTPIRTSFSAHLKYSLQYRPHSQVGQIYGDVYQGMGLAYYTFGDRQQLGDPIVLYLFQGARIARLASFLSLNYEWNLGLSGGWNPYDPESNPYNRMMGAKLNAYINTNIYLNWILSKRWNLTSGLALTHFSDGNTRLPNAGLNTVGMKMGLVYHFNREEQKLSQLERPIGLKFPRHVSYDLVVFGSWRRKGVLWEGEQVFSPKAYTVLGFNFNPMYNVGYKFRTGVSLDGVYDGSANVYPRYYLWEKASQEFFRPPLYKQLALGLSVRAEYVMPFFTIALGVGANILHGGGDLDAFYQILALKINITRNSFLHIGYSLQDFHNPSFLMLGVGVRFHNMHPLF